MTRRVLRYTYNERLVHALAAFSYLYLLLTGLAFWTPALYWVAVVLGGGYLSRLLHPWVGLLFAGALVWIFVAWRGDMRTTKEDRAWRKALRHYIRNEDAEVPPAWRFNYGQKLLFWLMIFGGVALLLSGLVLWFVASIPWQFRVLRYTAISVHAVAALATIGGFIIHVYLGTAVVPGGLDAVIHGEVTEEWARLHHPLWLAQITRDSADTSGGVRLPPSREATADRRSLGGGG